MKRIATAFRSRNGRFFIGDYMEFFTVFFLGAAIYGGIELIYRGYTHWTMLILGGICFSLMYLISGTELPFAAKLLLSALGITILEFGTGYLVNIILGWQIWDYSGNAMNLMGQICPLFSFIWLLLSIPGLLLCRWLSFLLLRLQA